MDSRPRNCVVQVEKEQHQQDNVSRAFLGDIKDKITLQSLNKNTLLFNDTVKERQIYVFNYSAKVIHTESEDPVVLNRTSLMYLKANKKWNLIKHPYIFNYLNEILLNSASLYIGHLLLYLIYLILLYIYIVTKNEICAYFIFIIILISFFMASTKAALKGIRANEILKLKRIPFPFSFQLCIISFKWCYSYLFTIITYFIVLIWIIRSYLSSTEPAYHDKNETGLSWLQLIVITTSWIQCLYVLKKSFFGLYILMLIKILKSFLKLIIIWITTVVCFAFSFQHVMRGSNVYPWDDSHIDNTAAFNKSTINSFAKVSVMMIGEVDANDIINKRELIASVILVLFEIIVIIILMNLMMSLAVDDVSKLIEFAEEKLLHVKVNYCIEVLHLLEYCCCPWITNLQKTQPRNIMIDSKKHKFQFSEQLLYDLDTPDIIVNISVDPLFSGNDSPLSIDNARIEKIDSYKNLSLGFIERKAFKTYLLKIDDEEGTIIKLKRLFIGLNFQYCSAKKCICDCCEH